MRNMEAMERLIKAGKYQKKAIHALLPESAEGHLQVIEREWKAMLLEMVMENISPEMILNFMKTMNSQSDVEDEEPVKEHSTNAKKSSKTKTKKVTID